MMSLRPTNYRHSDHRRAWVDVELDDDNAVRLTIKAQPGETFDDRDVARALLPDEARALAAMLWHYADEARRTL